MRFLSKNILALSLGIALASMAACSKSPEPMKPPAAAPSAATQATAQAAPAKNASAPAAAGATTPNPDAGKDPVFNMPPKPVLDVSASKAQYDKIYADMMK